MSSCCVAKEEVGYPSFEGRDEDNFPCLTRCAVNSILEVFFIGV